MGAIVLVLVLLLSLLAGAFSVAPAQAANVGQIAPVAKTVQISAATSEVVDTDGDGIENNQDPDVDGDGVVNGEDPDIDGDGIENFEDADPVDTTDVDSNAPEKPIRPVGAGDNLGASALWIFGATFVAVFVVISTILLAKRRKK
jgi:hypothetical protein